MTGKPRRFLSDIFRSTRLPIDHLARKGSANVQIRFEVLGPRKSSNPMVIFSWPAAG